MGPLQAKYRHPMLRESRASHVIIGHSERRTLYQETDTRDLEKN